VRPLLPTLGSWAAPSWRPTKVNREKEGARSAPGSAKEPSVCCCRHTATRLAVSCPQRSSLGEGREGPRGECSHPRRGAVGRAAGCGHSPRSLRSSRGPCWGTWVVGLLVSARARQRASCRVRQVRVSARPRGTAAARGAAAAAPLARALRALAHPSTHPAPHTRPAAPRAVCVRVVVRQPPCSARVLAPGAARALARRGACARSARRALVAQRHARTRAPALPRARRARARAPRTRARGARPAVAARPRGRCAPARALRA